MSQKLISTMLSGKVVYSDKAEISLLSKKLRGRMPGSWFYLIDCWIGLICKNPQLLYDFVVFPLQEE